MARSSEQVNQEIKQIREKLDISKIEQDRGMQLREVVTGTASHISRLL
jgi:hypothetical protein